MNTASILLALVVVLGCVREAGATLIAPATEFSFTIGDWKFGLIDYRSGLNVSSKVLYTSLHLGPFGWYEVPFTATQGLVGFGLILALLIIVPAVLTVRWKKKGSVIAANPL